MANPQLEDGFLRVATEIWEALCRIRVPGQARQVLDVVIRKTYGFNKLRDVIAISQIMKATGLKRGHVIRARDKLLSMNMIRMAKRSQKGKNEELSYSFQKDYESWQSVPKKVRGIKGVPKKVERGPKLGTTIDNTKDRREERDDLFGDKGKEKSNNIPYQLIIDDLNKVASTSFKSTSADTRKKIHARWGEGFQLEDFKLVHRYKFDEWEDERRKGGGSCLVWMRPSTLYRDCNFEGYLQSAKADL